MEAPGHFTDALGVPIFWLEAGVRTANGPNEPPIVLLHGLTDSHRTWRRLVPYLAARRRVLVPDLAGHGLSGRPDAPYTLEWHADVIGAWLAAVGVDEADVVGHSFGGGVAQYMLLGHRTRVRRLALVAAGGLGREVAAGLRLLAISEIVEHVGQPFMGPVTRLALPHMAPGLDVDEARTYAWLNARPGTARALSRTVRDVIDWRGQRRSAFDDAGRIAELPPIAVFWGDRDPVLPVAHLERSARAFEGVTTARFTGCGHFPQHTHAVELARGLEAFFDAEEARSARFVGVPRANVVLKRPSLLARAFRRVRRALLPARRREAALTS